MLIIPVALAGFRKGKFGSRRGMAQSLYNWRTKSRRSTCVDAGRTCHMWRISETVSVADLL